MVSDDAHAGPLLARGYRRLGDYEGSGLEAGKRGYYYSAVGGHATYHQGIMQTVHRTAMGVKLSTI